MQSTKRIFFMIFILAACFKVNLSFKPVEKEKFKDTNFILRELLVAHDKDAYISNMVKKFKDMGVKLPGTDSVSNILISIAKVDKNEHKVDFPLISNDNDMTKNLIHILNAYNEQIRDYLQGKKSTSNIGILKDLRKTLVSLYKHLLSEEIIKAMDNKNTRLDLDSFQDTLMPDIDKAVSEYMQISFNSTIGDSSNLIAYIDDIKKEIIDYQLEVVNQYLGYRAESVKILYNFADDVFKGITNNSVEWTDNTLDYFTSIFEALYHLDNSNYPSNLALIDKFATETVFPLMNKIEKERLSPIISMLFSFPARYFDNYSCITGRNMFLNYIFKNNVELNDNFYRSYLLRDLYKLKVTAKEYAVPILSFSSQEHLIYNADVVWSTGDCFLLEADFKNLMQNVDKYYDFDIDYLLYLNLGDRYFNVHREIIQEYKEIYRALYNVMLLQSAKLKNREFADESFVSNFEAFIAATKIKNLQFDDFDININTFYPVFKLINLSKNLEYFRNLDNSFLVFDDPNSNILEKFVTTLGEMKKYLDKWKVHVNQENMTKMFTLTMLSGQTIKREFTDMYLLRTKNPKRTFKIRV